MYNVLERMEDLYHQFCKSALLIFMTIASTSCTFLVKCWLLKSKE